MDNEKRITDNEERDLTREKLSAIHYPYQLKKIVLPAARGNCAKPQNSVGFAGNY
jgi:hypothetical protein